MSTQRNDLSEEGRQPKQEIPVIKVLRQDPLGDANLKGNSQILVIDDEKAKLPRLADREARQTDHDVMGNRHYGDINSRQIAK